MNETIQIMDLSKVIEIYLGEIILEGMNINQSKEFAFKEIQERTLAYRKKNNIKGLVEQLYHLASKLQIIYDNYKKNMSISFVNRDFLFSEIILFIDYGKQMYHPVLDLLTEYNSVIGDLTCKWLEDPEHVRYSSKFRERRDNFQSQEYFNNNHLTDFIFTKTNKWCYYLSGFLGFDFLKDTIVECVKSDVCLLPIDSSDGSAFDLELIFAFIILYNALKSKNSTLWFVFYENKEWLTYSDLIIEDIRKFAYMISIKSGFTFDLIPYTIITKNESDKWDYNVLLRELDDYTNKYISLKVQDENHWRSPFLNGYKYL